MRVYWRTMTDICESYIINIATEEKVKKTLKVHNTHMHNQAHKYPSDIHTDSLQWTTRVCTRMVATNNRLKGSKHVRGGMPLGWQTTVRWLR